MGSLNLGCPRCRLYRGHTTQCSRSHRSGRVEGLSGSSLEASSNLTKCCEGKGLKLGGGNSLGAGQSGSDITITSGCLAASQYLSHCNDTISIDDREEIEDVEETTKQHHRLGTVGVGGVGPFLDLTGSCYF